MPVGFDVTVPVPVPALVTSSDWLSAKVAVTVAAPVIVVVHEPVPLHAVPLPATVQPTNCEPLPTDAVSDSWLPCATIAVQVPGQLMPALAPVTVPVPEPPRSIVTRYCAVLNVAVTVVAASSVTVQVPVPVQPPPAQPANSAPVSGVAVSVTISPIANAAEHCAPQLMPPGFDVTAPVDVPSRTIVRFTVPGGPSITSASPLPSEDASMMPVKDGSSTEQAARARTARTARRAITRARFGMHAFLG